MGVAGIKESLAHESGRMVTSSILGREEEIEQEF